MLVSLREISRKFSTSEIDTLALQNVSLDIAAGEFLAITGPSGCGKSTLLNLIGLLDKPSAGKIEILGNDMSTAGERVRAHHRRLNIGFVFQGFNLIPELTVAHNVGVALQYRRMPRSERRELIENAVEAVGLKSRINHFPSELSGGQQQRVAIARAIVGRPGLILADEPTGNLDSRTGDEVMELMLELLHDGASLVMVTHSLQQASMADRILNMKDGRLIQ